MSTSALPDYSRLARDLAGEVVTADHVEYDVARLVWNGMIDRRPAAVVRCAGVDDVAASLAFAAEHQLPLAVRGGAHNVAGNATCDEGLVIDLVGLKHVEVDGGARLARAGGGVNWGEFDRATQTQRLATTGGLMPSTGIAGFTLGGGLGHLMRSCGLACDNLVSAEVVTADGSRLRADAQLRSAGPPYSAVRQPQARCEPLSLAGVSRPDTRGDGVSGQLSSGRLAASRASTELLTILAHTGSVVPSFST
jgi:FAD/FMN-containing dehydrogenase